MLKLDNPTENVNSQSDLYIKINNLNGTTVAKYTKAQLRRHYP